MVSGINIPLYRTIAKSNLTMDVPRYNSANDRHARFKSYGHRFDRKDGIEWKVFWRGMRLFVAILLPYLKFNFLGAKAVAGQVCHQWRRALAREREKNGGGDGTVEKACPRRFRWPWNANLSIFEIIEYTIFLFHLNFIIYNVYIIYFWKMFNSTNIFEQFFPLF